MSVQSHRQALKYPPPRRNTHTHVEVSIWSARALPPLLSPDKSCCWPPESWMQKSPLTCFLQWMNKWKNESSNTHRRKHSKRRDGDAVGFIPLCSVTHLPLPLKNVLCTTAGTKHSTDGDGEWNARGFFKPSLPWKVFGKTTWINLHSVLNLFC